MAKAAGLWRGAQNGSSHPESYGPDPRKRNPVRKSLQTKQFGEGFSTQGEGWPLHMQKASPGSFSGAATSSHSDEKGVHSSRGDGWKPWQEWACWFFVSSWAQDSVLSPHAPGTVFVLEETDQMCPSWSIKRLRLSPQVRGSESLLWRLSQAARGRVWVALHATLFSQRHLAAGGARAASEPQPSLGHGAPRKDPKLAAGTGAGRRRVASAPRGVGSARAPPWLDGPRERGPRA